MAGPPLEAMGSNETTISDDRESNSNIVATINASGEVDPLSAHGHSRNESEESVKSSPSLTSVEEPCRAATSMTLPKDSDSTALAITGSSSTKSTQSSDSRSAAVALRVKVAPTPIHRGTDAHSTAVAVSEPSEPYRQCTVTKTAPYPVVPVSINEDSISQQASVVRSSYACEDNVTQYVLGKDLARLGKKGYDGWWNDELINFIVTSIKQDESYHIFSSFFVSHLMNPKYGPQALKRWTTKRERTYDIFSKKSLFFPVNHEAFENKKRFKKATKGGGFHWSLIELQMQDKRITAFESLTTNMNADIYGQIREKLVQWLRMCITWHGVENYHICHEDFKEVYFADCPKQTNMYDCGTFTAVNLILRTQYSFTATTSEYSQVDMPYFRDALTLVIAESGDLNMIYNKIKWGSGSDRRGVDEVDTKSALIADDRGLLSHGVDRVDVGDANSEECESNASEIDDSEGEDGDDNDEIPWMEDGETGYAVEAGGVYSGTEDMKHYDDALEFTAYEVPADDPTGVSAPPDIDAATHIEDDSNAKEIDTLHLQEMYTVIQNFAKDSAKGESRSQWFESEEYICMSYAAVISKVQSPMVWIDDATITLCLDSISRQTSRELRVDNLDNPTKVFLLKNPPKDKYRQIPSLSGKYQLLRKKNGYSGHSRTTIWRREATAAGTSPWSVLQEEWKGFDTVKTTRRSAEGYSISDVRECISLLGAKIKAFDSKSQRESKRAFEQSEREEYIKCRCTYLYLRYLERGGLRMKSSLATAQSLFSLKSLPGESSIDSEKKDSIDNYKARKIREWGHEFIINRAFEVHRMGSHVKVESIIHDEDICHQLREVVRGMKPLKRGPRSFMELYNTQLATQIGGARTTISIRTASRWLKHLGFFPLKIKKGYFVDGHEREDVVKYRNEIFLPKMEGYEATMPVYSGENMDVVTWPGADEKTFFIVHDESIFKANDSLSTAWQEKGRTFLKSKSQGRSIMISSFMSAYVSTPDTYEMICPGKNYDKWWTNEDLVGQLETVIPILVAAHPPGSKLVFMFDNSSNHGAYAPDALVVNRLNLKGGTRTYKKGDVTLHYQMKDTEYVRDGATYTQKMQHDNGDHKGIIAILHERGLVTDDGRMAGRKLLKECKLCVISRKDGTDRGDVTTCCASRLLQCQPDFAQQRNWLQEIVDRYNAAHGTNHVLIFDPKFHCELNWIEFWWGWLKAILRKECKFKFDHLHTRLSELIRNVPIDLCRKWERRCFRTMSAYRIGAAGALLDFANRVYTSHRRVPVDITKEMLIAMAKSKNTKLAELAVAQQTTLKERGDGDFLPALKVTYGEDDDDDAGILEDDDNDPTGLCEVEDCLLISDRQCLTCKRDYCDDHVTGINCPFCNVYPGKDWSPQYPRDTFTAIPLPRRIPEDVKEHTNKTPVYVALYFIDFNAWFEGQLHEVLQQEKIEEYNRGKKKSEHLKKTMTMVAFDDHKAYDFLGTKETYGTVWVLLQLKDLSKASTLKEKIKKIENKNNLSEQEGQNTDASDRKRHREEEIAVGSSGNKKARKNPCSNCDVLPNHYQKTCIQPCRSCADTTNRHTGKDCPVFLARVDDTKMKKVAAKSSSAGIVEPPAATATLEPPALSSDKRCKAEGK